MTDNKKTEKKEDALWGEAGDINLTYPKWEKQGDKVKGTLVEKRENNTPDKWGNKNMEYILIGDNGDRICVQGRTYPKGKDASNGFRVIFGMDDIPLGAVMGFILDEIRETSMGNPAKIVKPKYLGDRDEKALEEYQSKFGGSNEVTSVADTTPEPEEAIDLDDIEFGEEHKEVKK